MRRRDFLATGLLLATTGRSHAVKLWRIGQVFTGSYFQNDDSGVQAGLEVRGYQAGRDFQIVNRSAQPNPSSVQEALSALIPNIDILLARGTLVAAVAKKVAPHTPTVFVPAGSPVAIGLVESLSRPGGNMTGVAFEAADETYGKRLAILKEIVPGLKRVAVLGAGGDANVPPSMASLERAAPGVGVQLFPVEVRSAAELPSAFSEMRDIKVDGLVVIAGAFTFSEGQPIAALALSHGVPAIHGFQEIVRVGGLVSLGPDLIKMSEQASGYVDKIMKGMNPGDLPVEQPSRYEIAVNLVTARALNLAIPPSLLARADEVIE